MPLYRWDNTSARYVNLRTGDLFEPFIPGETEPFYELHPTFMGERNIGVDPGVTLTPYTGTVTNGVATLTAGVLYENILFSSFVNWNGAHLRNCRIVIPANFAIADSSLNAIVRSLNGASTTGGTMERCEIHNRAQRPLNAVMGRNGTIRRTAVSGCVDGFVDSESGSAPQNYGLILEDVIVCDLAWFYSPTQSPWIHSSDLQTHNDCFQKSTTLACELTNFVGLAYASELVGTGTPGSGSETNTYVPGSGYNFIAAQAQMEAWRDTFCSFMTTPAQSKYGVAHRLPSSGGSMAAVMVNRGNLTVRKSKLAGGLVTVNMQDTNLPSVTNVIFEDNTFWNDMKNGHNNPDTGVFEPARKGHAITIKSGKTATFTNNKWFDGTNVTPVTVA